MTQENEMPREIWAKTYEAGTGHGEWDDYQPFQPNIAVPYIRADIAKNIIEDMATAVGTCQLENQPEWMEWIAELFTEHLKSVASNLEVKINKRGNLSCERK